MSIENIYVFQEHRMIAEVRCYWHLLRKKPENLDIWSLKSQLSCCYFHNEHDVWFGSSEQWNLTFITHKIFHLMLLGELHFFKLTKEWMWSSNISFVYREVDFQIKVFSFPDFKCTQTVTSTLICKIKYMPVILTLCVTNP